MIPMTDEQRLAAERVDRWKLGQNLVVIYAIDIPDPSAASAAALAKLMEDLEDLASAYIDEKLAAQDDGEVTAEWLEDSFPGVRVGHRGSRHWCCTLPQMSPCIQSNVFYLPFGMSRDEVRQLIAALNINHK